MFIISSLVVVREQVVFLYLVVVNFLSSDLFHSRNVFHRRRQSLAEKVVLQIRTRDTLLLQPPRTASTMAGLIADRVLLQSTPLSRDCFQVRQATKPPRILLPQIRSSLSDGKFPRKTLACTSQSLHYCDVTGCTHRR